MAKKLRSKFKDNILFYLTRAFSNRHVIISILATWLIVIFPFINTNAQILINEFQAANDRSVPEMYDFGDFSDWVELYNAGNETIDLSNYSLSDNRSKPEKWIFPIGFEIAAKGFVHLWADGENAVPGTLMDRPWLYADKFITKYFHLPFKLSKDGEEIVLFNPQREIVDIVEFPAQREDVSCGRKPDGGSEWFFFGDPSPGSSNDFLAFTHLNRSQKPEISPEGGFKSTETIVNIQSGVPGTILRYKLDGSIPIENDEIFDDEIVIHESTIISGRSWETGMLPSIPQHSVYIYDELNFNLPLISIACDPNLLWDEEKGIYTNNLKQRDIPILFEYFLNKSEKVVSTEASMKLSGQAAWQYPQKPFTIEANSDFGKEFLEFPFFSHVNNGNFKSLYLRNSGTPDTYYTMFRDAFCHSLVKNELDLDLQDYQPAVLYLNGDFWGIYNIREKLDKHYFYNHHHADPENISLFEYERSPIILADEGNPDEYYELLEFIELNDLSNPVNYEFIRSKIDIDAYINYMITQIYIDNTNWVELNVKWWKENKENAKWRWILTDTDISYGEFSSYPTHDLYGLLLGNEYPGWSTKLFQSLHQNESFRDEFIQRFAACLNTLFQEDRVISLIDSMQNKIADVMPYHIEKWKYGGTVYGKGPIQSIPEWETHINKMKLFASNRADYLFTSIKNKNDIDKTWELTLNKEGGNGKLYINSVRIPENNKIGSYFGSTPLRIEAIPDPGHEFVEWKDISSETIFTTTLTEDKTYIAVFKEKENCLIPSTITQDLHLDNSCLNYSASGDIIVPEGKILSIDSGVIIKMPSNAKIHVYGKLMINGLEESPVKIMANTDHGSKQWGGICFENSSDSSVLKNLQLIDASKGDLQKFPGAISSIQSKLILDNVTIEAVERPVYAEYGNIEIKNSSFRSPFSTDLINIKYADTVTIENCTLTGNEIMDSDAIDLDGVKYGVIKNNLITGFTGYNSDAIDLGEECKSVLIQGNRIFNINDKGISVGQGSTCTVRRNLIVGCGQGIGVKDFSSFANVDQNTFYLNKMAVACFEKNLTKGGGSAEIRNCIFSKSIDHSIFSDEHSTTNISYSLSDKELLSGMGNIFNSPQFNDEYSFNFELNESSPCIDTGDPESPTDPDLSNADMGAYYVFEIDPETEKDIIINEIHYHPSDDEFNSGEWFELYNKGNEKIDLSNWVMMDKQNNLYKFDYGIIIDAKQYLIVPNDAATFKSCYDEDIRLLDEFTFGLNNDEDLLRIFDDHLNMVDIVSYSDGDEWPIQADGFGPSLMLKNVLEDNDHVSNWYGRSFPTPGRDNYDIRASFKSHQKEPCSRKYKFHNTSSGIIDSVLWEFSPEHNSIEYHPEHEFDSFNYYQPKLSLHNHLKDDYIETTLQPAKNLSKPIVYDNFRCGSGNLEIYAEGQHDIHWFNEFSDTVAIAIGNTFLSPTLLESKSYFAADVYSAQCQSEKSVVLAEIIPKVKADFDYLIEGKEVLFVNNSKNASWHHWDFGDGESDYSSSYIIKHNYQENGTYYVGLKSWDSHEMRCEDEIEKEILVNSISTVDLKDDVIVIYPVPTKDFINILIPEKMLPIDFDMVDPLGNTFIQKHQIENLNFQITLPKSKGMYFLKFYNGGIKDPKVFKVLKI